MEIMLVLIIAIFTAILFRCIFEWTINKCSAMESVDAFVVAKQQGMIQQQIPNAGDATGGHGFTLQEQPWYKITFRMTDSTEKEFNVDNLILKILSPTTIYLWLISLTASKELSILLLKLLKCMEQSVYRLIHLGLRVRCRD